MSSDHLPCAHCLCHTASKLRHQINEEKIANRNVCELLRQRMGDVEALRTKVKELERALKVLRIAVNDKQPDPGAVAFIDRALAEHKKA